MTGIVEKNYSEALFAVIAEENRSVADAKDELLQVKQIIGDCGGFVKLMDSPAVTLDEKLEVIRDAFEGKLSATVYNFLCVVTESKRWGSFEKICKSFSDLCNEHLGIAEVTVTAAFPLTEKQREAIKAKMAEVIGKKIHMSEKTDKSIMGGIVVDYGDTRLDGSVRTRLEGLKESFSRLIG